MRITKRSLFVVLLVVSALLALAGQAIAAGSGASHGAVKFDGLIESLPSGTQIGSWVIGGKTVEVVDSTVIVEAKGPAVVGAGVVVIARRLAGDVLQALTIRVEDPAVPVEVVHIRGVITTLATDSLVVNGLTVGFNSDTRIVGTLAVDASVNIKANSTAAGYLATKIEVLSEENEDEQEVEFEGIIESLTDSAWVVGGRTVAVNLDTEIVGAPPAIGLKAEVRALVQADSSLLAIYIKVEAADDGDGEPEEVEFEGLIETMPAGLPAEWIIGGRTVTVNAETIITGAPAVGVEAEVTALRQADDSLVAIRIKIEIPRPTPTPRPERVPFSGAIVSFPAGLVGDWVIGATTVQVTADTIIHGTPQVGLQAEGQALPGAGGTLVAIRINISRPGDAAPVLPLGQKAKAPAPRR